jgi:O-antigen/teichoic acid export membrane protein
LRFRASVFGIGARFGSIFDTSIWFNLLKASWPVGIILVSSTIHLRVDSVLLSSMQGDSSVGLYNAALTLLNATILVPYILISSVLPVMSRYYVTSLDLFNTMYDRVFKLLMAVGLPLALAVTILSPLIINTMYGKEYAASSGALRILIWTGTTMYASSLVGTTFILANKQYLSMKLTLISVLLGVILNVLLIPRLDFVGSALAMLISEVFYVVVGSASLWRHGQRLHSRYTIMPLAAGIAGAVAVSEVLYLGRVGAIINAMVAVVVFAAAFYCLGINR